MPRFIGHARSQMAKRGISDEDVEAVLANHHIDYPSKHGKGRRVYVGEVGGRNVAVVAAPDAIAGIAVITAWCRD
jgi:uncharacterized DUF497 family protein